jgi:hypothetical protein
MNVNITCWDNDRFEGELIEAQLNINGHSVQPSDIKSLVFRMEVPKANRWLLLKYQYLMLHLRDFPVVMKIGFLNQVHRFLPEMER